ncbi:DUF418 domain-containing protein [Gramella sp. KN1008]|uniref:DUF418 domain-containing protein n=1 Tax=Gramella sp. KN1008 TaxID=2529298 RepID=UPI00103D5C25|nr:DUF418 domain-containing protein [Gramella sp. KN1008]TBW28706.1 DUF418 domain-containing protein [Gramella sp. KN1008]
MSVIIDNSSPINLSERADILDVLRGFALFGILVINIIAFSGYGFLTNDMKLEISTYSIDTYLSALQTGLAEGKFYSLFSLLFGIGFSIILMRLRQKGVNAFKIFYRRLFYLLIFGLIHIYFLWEGDILVLYAILGMILPLFINVSDRSLLIIGITLILSPILIDTAKLIFDFKIAGWLENIAIQVDAKTGVPLDNGYRRYLFREGSGWVEFWNWRQSGPFYRFSSILESSRIPKVLGMFLLGYVVGRNKIFSKLSNYKALFTKILKFGLIIGIPSTLIMVYIEWSNDSSIEVNLLYTVSYAFGVVPLALAYATGLALHWIKTGGKSKLLIFAPVGRMALTNYILQTVLAVLIFYELGLGLGGYIGPSIFLPIAIIIFVFQVILSKIWLKYFNYGPLEWIWRTLTYHKRIPFRKETDN